jgi:hypothetical protein
MYVCPNTFYTSQSDQNIMRFRPRFCWNLPKSNRSIHHVDDCRCSYMESTINLQRVTLTHSKFNHPFILRQHETYHVLLGAGYPSFVQKDEIVDPRTLIKVEYSKADCAFRCYSNTPHPHSTISPNRGPRAGALSPPPNSINPSNTPNYFSVGGANV